MNPLALDLCHGLGGWTNGFLDEGYRVIGVDLEDIPSYRGEHIRADVRTFSPSSDLRPCVVVASPPCEQFSRHQMPWTRSERIASILGVPIVIENVRMAQHWMGKAKWHGGAYYLWGAVPALMPRIEHRKKESLSSTARLERAMVPTELARWIAQCFRPT